MTTLTWREAKLTATQSEVLRRLVAGRLPKQIAADMHVELSTVREHLKRAREKTGTRNTVQLAVWAVRSGVLP